MTREHHDDEGWVFRLDPDERDALLEFFRLGSEMPRRPAVLSRRPGTPAPEAAERELHEALERRRREAWEAIRHHFSGAHAWEATSDGMFRWHLPAAMVDTVLRLTNEARVAAWERLGCPDFERGDAVDIADGLPSEDLLKAFWILRMSDRLQGRLLAVLAGED